MYKYICQITSVKGWHYGGASYRPQLSGLYRRLYLNLSKNGSIGWEITEVYCKTIKMVISTSMWLRCLLIPMACPANVALLPHDWPRWLIFVVVILMLQSSYKDKICMDGQQRQVRPIGSYIVPEQNDLKKNLNSDSFQYGWSFLVSCPSHLF